MPALEYGTEAGLSFQEVHMTTGESRIVTQDAPETPPSSDNKASTSAKTYTEAEFKQLSAKAVSDALAKAGRDSKALEQRAESLTAKESEITSKEEAIQDTQDKVEALKADLEELARDDPDREKILATLKRLSATEKAQADDLKAKNKALRDAQIALEADKAKWDTDREELQQNKRQKIVNQVAGEYQNASPERLTKLAEKFKATSEEDIREIAEGFGWTKKVSPLVDGTPASLVTSGAVGELTPERIEKMDMKDYAEHPSVKARYK
jgi:predicted RNase H-like nuclease (RuvC/YqgF family)